MSADWYCKNRDDEYGPLTTAEIKRFVAEGRITPESEMRKGDDGRWVSASKVKGLFDRPTDTGLTTGVEGHRVPVSSEVATTAGSDSRSSSKGETGVNNRAIIIGSSIAVATLVIGFLVLQSSTPKVQSKNNSVLQAPQDDLASAKHSKPAENPPTEILPQKPSLAERKANPKKVVARYSSGSLKSEYLTYADDNGKQVRHGKEAQWYEDGKDSLQGNWVDGQRDGLWKAWHKNGSEWVEGNFRAGVAEGHWSYLSDDGKSIGGRQDGVRVGVWRHWSKDGKTFAIGEYANGVKNGKWQFHSSVIDNELPNSSPTIDVEFKDGIWDGNLTVYNKKGEPEFHTYYEQGKEIPGKRVMYVPKKDQFGFPARERVDSTHSLHFMTASAKPPKPDAFEFIAGEAGPFEPLDTSFEPYREYWSNAGQLRAEGDFRLDANGMKLFRGQFKRWFSNGKSEISMTYKDGLKQGPYTEWYDNGEKKREGAYDRDKAVGKWSFWYASGRRKAELNLENKTVTFWEVNGDEAENQNFDSLSKSLLE